MTAIRDAATLILVRDSATAPRVLMGRRGAKAVFMPSKLVFPGGAVDPMDGEVRPAGALREGCAAALGSGALGLATTAIRELAEETGLLLGTVDDGRDAWRAGSVANSAAWDAFARRGLRPDVTGLSYVFRAVTPRGNPRRYDTRFLLCDADAVAGNPDRLPGAGGAGDGELRDLGWWPFDRLPRDDLPVITQIVLADISARLPDLSPPVTVPDIRGGAEAEMARRMGLRTGPADPA